MKLYFPRRLAFWLGLCVLMVWPLGPLYWFLVTSLMRPTDLTTSPISLVPPVLTLEHYKKLLGGLFGVIDNDIWRDFSRSMINSTVLALGATFITVATAVFSTYAAVRLRFPGRNLVFILIISTMAVPGLYGAYPAVQADGEPGSGGHLYRYHSDLCLGISAAGHVADAQRI